MSVLWGPNTLTIPPLHKNDESSKSAMKQYGSELRLLFANMQSLNYVLAFLQGCGARGDIWLAVVTLNRS